MNNKENLNPNNHQQKKNLYVSSNILINASSISLQGSQKESISKNNINNNNNVLSLSHLQQQQQNQQKQQSQQQSQPQTKNNINMNSLSIGSNISPAIYDKILQNQQELTNYLKYIRHKQPVPRIAINTNFLKQNQSKKEVFNKGKKQSDQVKIYVELYWKLIIQVHSLESYLGNKISKKILQFLEEFPTMSFLFQAIHSFGKDKKKISLNKNNILKYATDDMIPLFQKIIQKIQSLKKQGQSKKLLQLGHRIQHMQMLIDSAKNKISFDSQNKKIFKIFQSDRVQKYIMMEDNITKAEKNFGDFSQNFMKNKQVFSNLNKVYAKIKNSQNPVLL